MVVTGVLVLAVVLVVVVATLRPDRSADDRPDRSPTDRASTSAVDEPMRRVLIVGDSLIVGAAVAGLEDLTDVALIVKAFGGVTMGQGARVLADTDLSDYDEIVVALGSNNTTDTRAEMVEELSAVMDAVGDALPVVWVNLDSGGSLDVTTMNQVISSAVSDHPNLRIADWNAFISSVDEDASRFKRDGIHYTEDGYRVRARWLADVLDEFAS